MNKISYITSTINCEAISPNIQRDKFQQLFKTLKSLFHRTVRQSIFYYYVLVIIRPSYFILLMLSNTQQGHFIKKFYQ